MHMLWRCKAGMSFAFVSFLDTVGGITSCHSFVCGIATVDIIILTEQATEKFPCVNICKYMFVND